jgi:hypothetical protein
VDALETGQARSILKVPDYRRLWLVGLSVSVARWLEMLVGAVVDLQRRLREHHQISAELRRELDAVHARARRRQP